jgi:hypothetical protein
MFRGNGQRAACVVVVVPPSPSHNDRARPGRRRKKESQSFGLLRSRFMSIDCSALRTEVYRAVLRAAMAAPGFSSSFLVCGVCAVLCGCCHLKWEVKGEQSVRCELLLHALQ